jgi:glycosyltransferase involved in cell wall biosynthesis
MISVILPTYRNPDYLDLCLRSIVTNQVNQNEIIVVVDGYYKESSHILEKYSNISLVDLEKNYGMQHALNVGVWNASSEKIFIINDDNVFPPEWDVRLESLYSENTVMTVNQIEPTGPGMFNFPVKNCGLTFDSFDVRLYEEFEETISSKKTSPDGSIFPFLINKRWYMAVGGFDIWYDSPNLCDWDFFYKLQLLPNLKLERTHSIHLYHFGSVATKKNKESDSFIRREKFAQQQYQYKWGHLPFNGHNNRKIYEK